MPYILSTGDTLKLSPVPLMMSIAGLFYLDIKLIGTGAQLMLGVPYQACVGDDEIPDAYEGTKPYQTIEYPTPGTGSLSGDGTLANITSKKTSVGGTPVLFVGTIK
jgi:hypothetical protein